MLHSIGYKARVEFVPHDGRYVPGVPTARRASAGYGSPTTRPPTTFLLGFLCSSYTTEPATNQNPAGICDRRLDAQVARAQSLETTNPAAAAGAWHSIDRMLTDEAPWVPMKVFLSTDFVAPAGRQLQVLVAVGVERVDRREPRPALGPVGQR